MDDDPLTRLLTWIDTRLRDLDRDHAQLTEVRARVVALLGEGQPDGWLQTGTRADD